MKKTFFILAIMFCCNISFAQISIERQVIGSTGNLINTEMIKAFSNIGEVVIPTFSQNVLVVTQGFEQPDTIMMTGINLKNVSIANIFIYPNPVEDFLNIEFQVNQASLCKIQLRNLLGQIVLGKDFQTKQGMNKLSFEVKPIPSGIYVLNVQNNQNYSKKIVVKK